MKQVKIPEDLFLTLVKYHLAGIDPEINEKKIKAGLPGKDEQSDPASIFYGI